MNKLMSSVMNDIFEIDRVIESIITITADFRDEYFAMSEAFNFIARELKHDLPLVNDEDITNLASIIVEEVYDFNEDQDVYAMIDDMNDSSEFRRFYLDLDYSTYLQQL